MAGNGSPEELSTRQRRAIAALLAARTIAEAAKTAGVGERTLHTWLDKPYFKAALRVAEEEAIGSATRRLVGMVDTALNTIKETLDDTTQRPADRLKAANMILVNMLSMRDLHDIERRLAALEARD